MRQRSVDEMREAARRAIETRRERLRAAEGLTMKDLPFGVEIEVERLLIPDAARVLISLPGWRHDHRGAVDPQGRVWHVVRDGSVPSGCEVVTPKLGYADLELVQAVVRALRAAGGRVSPSCGLHIHVDASRHDHRSLARLAKMAHAREASIFAALGAGEAGRSRYAQSMDGRFVAELARRNPSSRESLNRMWYGVRNSHPAHYDNTRYRGLNLHAVWDKGTVEFRYFGGTLHAGEVKAYIQWCLAVSHKALTSPIALIGKVRRERERTSFGNWLRSLGLKGPEFKTCRKHWLKRLADRAVGAGA